MMTKFPKSGQYAAFIPAHEAGITNHIGCDNCR
jgi:hypothetical protein